MCIPWIQSFLLGTVLIRCLEHALYLVGTLKLNIELRNVWLCGGPAGYFCLYHCSILCMCVTEIPFHLTFSSCTRLIPYLGNCSLLYWPRHDSHLGWACCKFSFLRGSVFIGSVSRYSSISSIFLMYYHKIIYCNPFYYRGMSCDSSPLISDFVYWNLCFS